MDDEKPEGYDHYKLTVDLMQENKTLRLALEDIIKFCEQFELSETKKETLTSYRTLLKNERR